MDGYALGKTKVFLKYFHLEYLSKLYERQMRKIVHVQVKFIYSEKVTKFCEISTVDLTNTTSVGQI